MRYVHTEDTSVRSLDDIRAENPLMSIPDGADLSEIGYQPLSETPSPPAPEWHMVEPGAPASNGGWHTTWVIREMTPEEKSSRAESLIGKIERDSLIPRIVREATIFQLEAWATSQGYPLDQFRLVNKGYRLLKEADEAIAELRKLIP